LTFVSFPVIISYHSDPILPRMAIETAELKTDKRFSCLASERKLDMVILCDAHLKI